MGVKVAENIKARGFVDYELIDDATGKVKRRGRSNRAIRVLPSWLDRLVPIRFKLKENAINNTARNLLADAFIGTSVTFPTFIGIGTGTNAVSASDTALQTPVDYDGANEAKVVDTKSLRGQYTARLQVQFSTTEANQTITELGLFDAANSGTMWARVSVNVTKTATERLNVYWYVTFERRTSLAIKSGTSIGATGTITANTDSTLTFASAVTIIMIQNNHATEDVYLRFNAATVGGATPTEYDILLAAGEKYISEEEILSVSTIHVVTNQSITMPHNALVVRGW